MDLDLDQAQKVLASGAGLYSMADQGAFLMIGLPRGGQSLEEVEALLLGEMEKLRKGEFSNELVEAIKANLNLNLEKSFLNNSDRANYYVDAFVNGETWGDAVKGLHRMNTVTKQDVVNVANKYLGNKNYAAVSKRQGAPKDELKIAKPAITPIVTNRDTVSAFLADLVSMKVDPVEPKFVDFQKDLKSTNLANGTQLLYTHNTTSCSTSHSFMKPAAGPTASFPMRHSSSILPGLRI